MKFNMDFFKTNIDQQKQTAPENEKAPKKDIKKVY